MSRKKEAGFSLLEILVAFSVMALTLGVLLRIFGGGNRIAIAADEYARAIVVAEGLLASAGMEAPLEEGETHGEVGETYHWTLRVSPFPVSEDLLPQGNPQVNLQVKPYWVELSVEWGEGDESRSFELQTLRLLQSNPIQGAGPGLGRGPLR